MNQSPSQSDYWGPFFVCGEEIELAHLEPFEFQCPTPDGSSRRVRVLFSPHVFTRKHDIDDPPGGMCFDGRICCQNRYEDSRRLKDIIVCLPYERVYQTWERRNYVFLATETPQCDDRYHLFFSLKKDGGKRNRHIQMWVESAYRQENSPYCPPHRSNSVRFKVLIQNVFMGRPLNFSPR